MTRQRTTRLIVAVILAVVMAVPATAVFAATGPSVPPPVPVIGPRLSPPVFPTHPILSKDLDANFVFGGLTPPNLPVQSIEANAADGGRTQEKMGRGIRQTVTDIGYGLALYPSWNVCNDFNTFSKWAASDGNPDIWTDWYGGWAPFAIDNGYYKAQNVAFTMERSVGPGNLFNDEKSKDGIERNSLKIASTMPYAAGVGSPRIPVPAGYEGGRVQVSVKYLIFDHDTGGKLGGPDGFDYDWASMGVKAGADAVMATYVNGYVRGEWAELTNNIELGDAKDVMVLLQGQSPGLLNSNIYFDDVKIAFIDASGTGKYLTQCVYDGQIK